MNMLAWRDMAVFYANNKMLETSKIPQSKCTTSEDLEAKFIYEACTGTLYLDGDYGFYKEEFAKDCE